MLWRQAADFHLRGGEPDVAAKSLEELLRINPGDKKTLAQLVVAYAQVSIVIINTLKVCKHDTEKQAFIFWGT
jgi:hypothetical protein